VDGAGGEGCDGFGKWVAHDCVENWSFSTGAGCGGVVLLGEGCIEDDRNDKGGGRGDGFFFLSFSRY